jgi:hypothetical protein
MAQVSQDPNGSRALRFSSLADYGSKGRRICRFGSMGRIPEPEWRHALDSGAAKALPGPDARSRCGSESLAGEPGDRRAASLDTARSAIERQMAATRPGAAAGPPGREFKGAGRSGAADSDLEKRGRRPRERSSRKAPVPAPSGGDLGSGFFSRLLRGLGGGSGSGSESGRGPASQANRAGRRRGSYSGGQGEASGGLAVASDPVPCQRSYILSPSRRVHLMRTSTV